MGGLKVFVYYNLHKHTWSIKALEGPHKGLVIGHSDTVLLQDAAPKVSEAGRQRVLRDKRRNVHAGIVGTLVHREGEGYFPGLAGGAEITYNPYKYAGFVYTENERPYTGSDYALLAEKRVYVYYETYSFPLIP